MIYIIYNVYVYVICNIHICPLIINKEQIPDASSFYISTFKTGLPIKFK